MDNQTYLKFFRGKGVVYIFILVLPFIIFYWQLPFVPFSGKLSIGNDYVGCTIREQMEIQYALVHGSFPLYVPGFHGGQTSSALTLAQLYHPVSHLAAALPGYWQGDVIQWLTLLRLLSLGLVHLGLYILLRKLRVNLTFSFIISFITVYNLRMLDMFRYGAALENYLGCLMLCMAMAFYYIKPTRFTGPISIIASAYLLICGGHPQMMYYGLLGAGIAGVALPFVLGKISAEIKVNRPRLVKYFTTVGTCIVSGIILSSAYIIPFYFDFLTANTRRTAQGYQWSLEFGDTVGGVLNSFFAPLHSDGHSAFGSSSIILLIVFVPLLYFARKKIPTAITLSWSILALIFLCGLGETTPVHYFFWKTFPFAQDFRIPGRIFLVFPFLFLLILAWLFRSPGVNVNSHTKPSPAQTSLYQLPALAAVPLFLLYNWLLVKFLPGPARFTPEIVNPYPQWMNSLVLWMGLLTLILVVVFSFFSRPIAKYNRWRGIIGILLAVTVIIQVTAEIRYGTWVVKNHPQPTLEMMDNFKKRNLTYFGGGFYGMESTDVARQMSKSILEPTLAKFYRKYKYVSNQNKAYRFLNKENVTDRLVVEAKAASGPKDSLNDMNYNAYDAENPDEIQLEESGFNRVLFSVKAGAPGFLAISFPYSNKWNAAVNGNRVRIYRANGNGQAVYLEAGQHKIEFRYWSSAAFAGILVSCLTFLFIGCYFALFVFKGKKRLLLMTISIFVPAFLFFAWYTSLYSGDNLGTQYTWSTKEFPPRDNLAYAKKASMDLPQSWFYAGRGVDGDTALPAVPFRTVRKKAGWWQVDLGSPKQLGEIVLYDSRFLKQKNLPLIILGSMDDKTFMPLKEAELQEQDKPWRITMNGEITRFVRLQSPAETSLSFSEVEIYPPPAARADKGKLLLELVRSRPITTTILNHIDLLARAVQKGDNNALQTLLEKEKNTGKETGKILILTTLTEAVKYGRADMVKILRDRYEYVTLSSCAPCIRDILPGKIVDVFLSKEEKSPAVKELKVWNKHKSQLHMITPSMFRISRRGIYKFDVRQDKESDESENCIVVHLSRQKKEQKPRIQFGYEFNRRGLDEKIPEGKYVNFIVRTAISPHLLNIDNCIVAADYKKSDKSWEQAKTVFTSHQWRTYMVSKKVRPGINRLVLMFRFTPQSQKDRLWIKNAKIVISEKPL